MHITIIGPGLIGRSISLAARRADPAARITEIDRGESLAAARDADLIVLATPVDVILDLIRRQPDVLRRAVVIDTGSTKRAIVTAARDAGLTAFVGGHPMAGGTSSGPDDASATLFDGCSWFLVPHGAPENVVAIAEQFVGSLGAIPIRMTDDGTEHDRVMGAVSHLPQLVASTLMVVVAEAAGDRVQWAGTGLRDTTRLALSSAEVWRGILATNAAQVAPLVRVLARHLDAIADQLDAGGDAGEWLDKGKRARELL